MNIGQFFDAAFAPRRVLTWVEHTVFQERPWRLVFGIALLLAVATVFGRPPAFDDAWFGDQAHFVATEGRLRSELFRGMLGWEEWVYITQKASVLLTAVCVRLLGLVPLATHLCALLYATLCCLVVIRYLRRVRPGDRSTPLVAGSLFVANGSFVDFAFLVRPELMLAALAFASYAVLDGVFVRRWSSGRRATLAGALAGASALFHLNGSMIMTAGGLFLLVRRQWLATAAYSLAALAVASLYAADAVVRRELPRVATQFLLDPATTGTTSAAQKLANIGEIHQVFFHSPGEMAITLSTLFAVLVFRHLRRAKVPTPPEVSGLVTYVTALLVAFTVLLNRPAHMYALLFCPFSVALFSLLYGQLRQSTDTSLRRAWAGILVACLVAGTGHDVGQVVRNARSRDEVKFNEYVASLLPKKNVAVIAPVHFVFGQVDNFRIMGLAKYAFPDRETGLEWDVRRLMSDAARWNVEYVIFERRRGFDNFDPAEYPERVGDYVRFVERPPLTIYRRDG